MRCIKGEQQAFVYVRAARTSSHLIYTRTPKTPLCFFFETVQQG
jgi:hypothetical protein